MEPALLATRLLLLLVFVVAGAAKLADQEGSRRALVDFGAPEVIAGVGAVVLPWIELIVGLSLLATPSAWYGAIAALVLLFVFVLGIAYSLAKGRAPDCHCFGQLHSAPAGWPTLARNAALAALAGFLVWSGPSNIGPSAIAWIGDLSLIGHLATLGAAVALALLAGQGALLFQIIRQQGRMIVRLEELEAGTASARRRPDQPAHGVQIGAVAPAFRLQTLQRRLIALTDLLAGGKPVLLIFANPGCGPCNAMMPEIASWQRQHAASLSLAIVSEGALEDNAAKASQFGLELVLLQEKREVAEAYHAHGTPSAVLIGADGLITTTLHSGVDAIRALVSRASGLMAASAQAALLQPAPPVHPGNGRPAASAPLPVVGIGQTVPTISLFDLYGNPAALPELRGESTMLLFWNNGCGFCRAMLEDLRAWEADKPHGSPRLVLISSGDFEQNRGLKLRSRILLDNEQQVSRRFGANGTPMAVMLDENARVASTVAAGAKAVFELARGYAITEDAIESRRANGDGEARPAA